MVTECHISCMSAMVVRCSAVPDTEAGCCPCCRSAAHQQQLPCQPLPLPQPMPLPLPPPHCHMHPEQVPPLSSAAYPSGFPTAPPSATPAAETLSPDTDCELQSWAWERSLAPINNAPQTPRYPSPFSPMGNWLGDADAEVSFPAGLPGFLLGIDVASALFVMTIA